MKLRGLIASLAAATVAVSATVSASAALCSDELAASGAPAVNAYLLAGVEGVDYTQVAKIEAVVTTSDYVNGTIGVSVGGEWTTCGQVEASAGTATWTLDGLTGIDATLDDGSLKSDVVQVQFWWLNAGTYSLDALTLFDAEGNVLQEAGAEEEAPAEETTEEAATGAALDGTVNTALYVGESATWVTAASDVQAISTTGEYTFKIDGLAIPADKLTVIYVKDADVEGGAATETAINADTQIVTKSVKVNDTELTLTDGYNTALSKGVLDVCWYNIWGTHYVDLGDIAEINSVEVTVELALGAAADEEVAEEVEEEATEEEATEEEATEEEATEEEELDAEEVLEPDWDSYDEDAMVEANEAFVFGESTAIDIYAVVGDAWADIAVIEADFVWTPGTGWCGGAGIGNGAVAADGSSWISGPEYGCANANQGLVDDGAATQVLVDLSENPLTAIASVNAETGETTFGHIQVQNWWNGVEAGAQMAAIRFLDADGEVLGEVTYDVEAPEAVEEEVEEEAPVVEEEAPATGDVDGATDSSKGSPDTGIEDVAVVAGLAIVAAGAVLVSKKRK